MEVIKNKSATDIDQKLHDLYAGSTCAVVGSAGAMLDHEYGPLIDECDIIIRCNQAPSTGYEKYVGSSTDVRLVNSHYFTALKGTAPPSHASFLPRMRKIFPSFKEDLLFSLKDEIILVKHGVNRTLFAKEIAQVEKNNNTVVFMSDAFYQDASSLIGTHATNGFVSILLALKYFSKVGCFGFTFCREMQTPSWARLYYFMEANPPRDSIPDCHSNQSEEKIVKKFADAGIIELYPC